ncbi:MAG TPA: hypothetical protein VMX74_02810 [Pirellulales bacterium]|nr:hypothetical protein [Pirellulales bacterium]
MALSVVVGSALLSGVANAGVKNKNGGREQVLSLSDLPNAVKASLLVELFREIKGLVLDEVEREMENGKTVYEIAFRYGNKEMELEFSADGKLLEKVVKRDEDHDEDANQDHHDTEEDDDTDDDDTDDDD